MTLSDRIFAQTIFLPVSALPVSSAGGFDWTFSRHAD